MKRFTTDEWEDQDTGCMVQGGPVEHTYGEYVLFEDVEPIIADRDIKAANLKTLVDMVLDYDAACVRAAENGGDGGDIADCTDLYKGVLELARGLKQ